MKSALFGFRCLNHERRLRSCSPYGSIFVAGLMCLLVSIAAAQGDIELQVGKEFSFYSSGNCRKLDHAGLDVALTCRFGDKQARFYFKESPLSELPRAPTENLRALIRHALAVVVREIDPPDLMEYILLPGGSSLLLPDQGRFTWYGIRYEKKVDTPGYLQTPLERVLIRGFFVRGYGMAYLVAFSDFDFATHSESGRGVPQQVSTMLRSLDLKHARIPWP